MTVTEMGGIPERASDGTLVLNNHGRVSAPGGTGWHIALVLHWLSLGAMLLAFIAAGVLLAVKGSSVGHWEQHRYRRLQSATFVVGLTLTGGWAVLITSTGIASWIARLP